MSRRQTDNASPAGTKGRNPKSKTQRSRRASGERPPASKEKGKKPGAQAPSGLRRVLPTLFGMVFLLLIGTAIGWVMHGPGGDGVPESPPDRPTYEVFPDEEPEDRQVTVLPFPDRPPALPRVAVIIDDIGYNRVLARKLIDLDRALTFSVLPQSPHCREIAAEAYGKGLEIMLHLPMEPMEYPRVNPGPGALLVSMEVDRMIDLLYDHLEEVPYAVGVNNHMGSRLTTVSTRMYQIFTVLKKKDLFFIDSRTSAQSLCKPSARLLQIAFGERDVFLDHSLDRATIRKQVGALIEVARRNGQAIGIGHPHAETYEVLRDELPEFRKKVRLVHASELVKPLG
ncbi:hypothetical protein JCM14469_17340 [Desulfatiferula olefinivorans]